jgi:hypothetical protein
LVGVGQLVPAGGSSAALHSRAGQPGVQAGVVAAQENIEFDLEWIFYLICFCRFFRFSIKHSGTF